jgi:hypothetical protein
MSKEAMKLALEALEVATTPFARDRQEVLRAQAALREALAKPDFWEGYVPEPVKPAQQLVDCHATGVCVQSGLRAEQPAQQDSTCSNALRAQGKAYPRTCKKCGLGPCVELAQQALDKKAENARELGLDYEPAQPVVWHDAPQTIYLQVCPEADHCEVPFADHDEVTWCQDKIHDSDIAYVRASTAQQPPAQQEPVVLPCCGFTDARAVMWNFYNKVVQCHNCGQVYTSPPAQRTWVSLTDEEVDRALDAAKVPELPGGYESVELEIARAIEAKLKEKNNV